MAGTALVTGATGFIGHHVAADLIANGWRVRALVREESTAMHLPFGAEPVPGDVRDAVSVVAAARGCDAVFHVAALYSLRRSAARDMGPTNVRGTANVVAAAGLAGAKLVHTSSVSTIGVPEGGGVGDETTPLRRSHVIGAYKRSKVQAEMVVADAVRRGAWAVIVNPSAPIGPGDRRPTPTGRVVLDFLRGRMVAVVDTGLNLVDVRDVAAGHRLALERGEPGRRYILGNANVTLAGMLRMLGEETGLPAPTRRIPHAAAIGVAAVDELVEGWILRREPLAPLDGARMARRPMYFSAARAVKELKLPQSPVRDALRDAAEWYYAAGLATRAAAPPRVVPVR